MPQTTFMRTALHPHPPVPTGPLPDIQVGWTLNADGWLEAIFSVTLPPGETWHTDPLYSRTDYAKNWGLWDQDVVELFVQPRPYAEATSAPYYEMQLSPLGQPFALRIEEPRQRFEPPQNLAYTKQIALDGPRWLTRLAVRIPDYEPGAPLFGNLTACLGPADRRSYFTLVEGPGEGLDFHRPQEFVQLV